MISVSGLALFPVQTYTLKTIQIQGQKRQSFEKEQELERFFRSVNSQRCTHLAGVESEALQRVVSLHFHVGINYERSFKVLWLRNVEGLGCPSAVHRFAEVP